MAFSVWGCLIRVLIIVFLLASCVEMQEAHFISDVNDTDMAMMASGLPAVDDHTSKFTESDAITYLKRFGYLPDNKQLSAIITKSTVSKAIVDFQDFTGLNATGVLDKDTINLMLTPRCGVKDKQTFTSDSLQDYRVKRYVIQGSRWPKYDLKYKIITYPRKSYLGRSVVDKDIARAFAVWSEYTDLTFKSVRNGPVDIEIKFESRSHDDSIPFDGRGIMLAHAYYPRYGGAVHFDDDEDWTVDSKDGTNLFQVAAHEIGHALGLDHTEHHRKDSVMYAFYREYDPDFKLSLDDIQGIQAIYGPKTIKSTERYPKNPVITTSTQASIPSLPTKKALAPDLCKSPKIDAVFHSGGSIFFFLGDYYWRMVDGKMVDGYPQLISNTWPGLPGNIDAAFSLSNTYTYFFKGSKCWKYSRGYYGEELIENYPKEISMDFPGIPNDVNAATVMVLDDLIYFFKGRNYYTYDWDNANFGFGPIPISGTFPLLENGVDAVYTTYDYVYLFHNSKFFTYDYKLLEVEGERSMITRMFRCPKE